MCDANSIRKKCIEGVEKKNFKSILNIREKIRKLFMQIYSNCDIIIQTCLATETITSIIHKAYYEVINSHLCDS